MRLSLVVPCYNEEQALPKSVPQLRALLADLIARGKIAPDSNIWLIDDGSRDATWSVIDALARADDMFVGVKLSRNRGHQNALLAGLLSADGDALISIDADLQDDLSVIEQMIDAHAQGYEIVYGVREGRRADSFFKRWTALGYYSLLKRLGVDIVPNHADFRLMGRASIKALAEHSEVNLFLRGIVPQLGFRSTTVRYDRLDRIAGETKYPVRRMLGLAFDGITSFSPAPLRAIAGLGAIICVISLGLVLWVLFVRLFTDHAVPGWASITVPIYFLGGIQLLCIGVVGEYVAKIYSETKGRPRFIIEKVERKPRP